MMGKYYQISRREVKEPSRAFLLRLLLNLLQPVQVEAPELEEDQVKLRVLREFIV